MFGFGGKKNTPAAPAESTARVQTIPDVFYGGNDPEVYKHVEVGSPASVSVKPTPAAPPKPKPLGAPVPTVAEESNHRGLKWSAGIIGTVLIIGGISWYYLQQYRSAKQQISQPAPLAVTPPAPSPVVEEPATTTPAVVETPPETTPATSSARSLVAGGPLEFPALNPQDAADFDHDFLTDSEEEAFGTDPATWDTDKDGYYDGQEVYNLYNPKGFAPIRLIDSGLIQEYINPFAGYRIYYPQNWRVAAVDSEGQQVVLTASNGDYIEIRVVKKTSDEEFTSWFGRVAEGEKITDLLQAVNRFSISGWHRRDDLTAYFASPTAVYTLIYHPLAAGPVNYRHAMQMVVQSFRPGKATTELPAQPLLPGTATTNSIPVATSTTSTAF